MRGALKILSPLAFFWLMFILIDDCLLICTKKIMQERGLPMKRNQDVVPEVGFFKIKISILSNIF
jgi:uncharacterized metal-binding protein